MVNPNAINPLMAGVAHPLAQAVAQPPLPAVAPNVLTIASSHSLAPFLRLDAAGRAAVDWATGQPGVGKCALEFPSSAGRVLVQLDVVQIRDGSLIAGRFEAGGGRFFALSAQGGWSAIFYPAPGAGAHLWQQKPYSTGPTLDVFSTERSRFYFSLCEAAFRHDGLREIADAVLHMARNRQPVPPGVTLSDLHAAWGLLTESWDPREEDSLQGVIARLIANQPPVAGQPCVMAQALAHIWLGFGPASTNQIDLRDQLALSNSSRAWWSARYEIEAPLQGRLVRVCGEISALHREIAGLNDETSRLREAISSQVPGADPQAWDAFFDGLAGRWRREDVLLGEGFVPTPGLGLGGVGRDLATVFHQLGEATAAGRLAHAILQRVDEPMMRSSLSQLRTLGARVSHRRGEMMNFVHLELQLRYELCLTRKRWSVRVHGEANQMIWSEFVSLFSVLPEHVSVPDMLAVLALVASQWRAGCSQNAWASFQPQVCLATGLPELLNQLTEAHPELDHAAMDHLEDVVGEPQNARSLEVIRYALHTLRIHYVDEHMTVAEAAALGQALARQEVDAPDERLLQRDASYLLSALRTGSNGPGNFNAQAWFEIEADFYNQHLEAMSQTPQRGELAARLREEITTALYDAGAEADAARMLAAFANASALTRAMADGMGAAATVQNSLGVATSMMRRRRGGDAALEHALAGWHESFKNTGLHEATQALKDTAVWYTTEVEPLAVHVFNDHGIAAG